MSDAAHGANGERLQVRDHGPVRELRLARPEVHNALDEELIRALTAAFTSVPASTRAVLLSAEGKSFCAGADLLYMQRVAAFSAEENRADARRLAALFRAVRDCPAFVLGRIQGTALGGGCGLVAACDLAVAAAESRFGFTEVRLGIVPATISPFVIDRIGAAKARALFPTGEVFDAAEALRIGLVDRVVPGPEVDAAIDRVLASLLAAAPGASREAKGLAGRAEAWVASWHRGESPEATAAESADLIARMRALPEGREGIAAFLGKRKPSWAAEPPDRGTAAPGAPGSTDPS
jgi:methylglutaconyl-CoA hydratase